MNTYIMKTQRGGGGGGKKEKQTRILTFIGVKKAMLCACRKAQPGKCSPWQVLLCQGRIAWRHSQVPMEKEEALEAWFIFHLSLFLYLT